MNRQIVQLALVVRDYDEAIEFFVEKLDFDLIEDTRLNSEKRWVVVRPKGSPSLSLLLAKASTPEQLKAIGNQTGGRVFLFLYTDDLWRDHKTMKSRGIHFLEEPRNEPYGTVVVFEDLYGNKWDMIQPA